MDAVIELLKMLLKGVLLFVGGLMLLGGGLCAIIGVGNMGHGGLGLLGIVGIALVVALFGWGMIQAAKAIGQSGLKSSPLLPEEPSNVSRLVLILMAVAAVVAIGLSILRASLG